MVSGRRRLYHLPLTIYYSPLMASRLTVIFYILLCLEAGVFLTLLPWWQPWGMGDWGDNFFLVMVAQKTGFVVLQRAVASGWVRGAVSGIGLLNIGMGIWELINFRRTVRALDEGQPYVKSSGQHQPPVANVAQPVKTDPLSDYPRRNH